jgi:PadR family transcriptional regulator PadR
MRGEDLVATRWQESSEGPPRRYYYLTATGLQALQAFRQEWIRFRNVVDKVLRLEGDR